MTGTVYTCLHTNQSRSYLNHLVYRCINVICKREKDFSESKHNCLFVNFIIRLTTCFGPSATPSSGHKIYKEEKLYLYSICHKI